ncbi:MAG: hypothetical protein D3909_15845, partial [Candidatus Electrothrix sp. ATG1]|nr:hypothetical protein [Candidatus Electrothrix sp. ATG1]
MCLPLIFRVAARTDTQVHPYKREEKMNLLNRSDNHAGNVQQPWLTAILCIATLTLFLIYGEAPTTLVYDRTAIAQGEIWRLLTGHFT